MQDLIVVTHPTYIYLSVTDLEPNLKTLGFMREHTLDGPVHCRSPCTHFSLQFQSNLFIYILVIINVTINVYIHIEQASGCGGNKELPETTRGGNLTGKQTEKGTHSLFG